MSSLTPTPSPESSDGVLVEGAASHVATEFGAVHAIITLEQRRREIVVGHDDFLSLAGLVRVSNSLGIAPSGLSEITEENLPEWISAAANAIPSKVVLNAYHVVLSGQLTIDKGELPTFTRDLKRFRPVEVYLSSLMVLLKASDEQQLANSPDGPYWLKEQCWSPEWEKAVDSAVGFREAISGLIEDSSFAIDGLEVKRSIDFRFNDRAVSALIIGDDATMLVGIRGAEVTSVALDTEHPWWQAEAPAASSPAGLDIYIKMFAEARQLDLQALAGRAGRSLHQVLFPSAKYPDLNGLKITTHFVVQPLPILEDERAVRFFPSIPVAAGKYFIDCITADKSVVNTVVHDCSSESAVTVAALDGRSFKAFEAIPMENLGSWREALSAKSSPWIDRNIIVAVKPQIEGEVAAFLREVISASLHKPNTNEKIGGLAGILARKPAISEDKLIQALIDKNIITDDEAADLKIKSSAGRKADRPVITKKLFALGDDTSSSRSFSPMRGGGFGGMATQMSNLDVGQATTYLGPDLDCDPLGNIEVYVIMPVAINGAENLDRQAQDWFRAFKQAALGN